MKKQHKEISQQSFALLFFVFLIPSFLTAQTDNITELNANGYSHSLSYNGIYQDRIVPSVSGTKYLKITIRGGDGGARINTALIDDFKTKGGGGATYEAFFEIGSGENRISPGDLLRFIIGKNGGVRNSGATVGAAGGGGTGLFLKKSGSSNWKILMVAGAGGGAYSDCCTSNSEGRSASTSPNGSEGGGLGELGGDGGTNGNDGNVTGSGFAGKGVNNQFTESIRGPFVTSSGTYGIGSGGDKWASGGGGGGFSGGGAGDASAGGGGGGSYLTDDFVTHYPLVYTNPKTNNPKNGFAEYEFTSDINFGKAINWLNSSWCIDNYGSRTTNYNKIQLYGCNGTSAQKWVFLEDFTIRLENAPNMCLDLDQSHTSNNTKIQLHECNGSGAQKWIFEGTTRMIRFHNNMNKCLTFDKHNASNGSQIYIYDCSRGNIAQQWSAPGFSAAYTSPSTVKSIRPDYAPNMAVDKTSVNAEDAKIWLYDYSSDNINQQWIFDGFSIKLKQEINNTKMCIDLPHRNTGNGQDLQLHHCNNTDAQFWIYDGIFKAIRYKANPSKCIDVENGSDARRAIVQLWDCKGIQAQRFLIK